MSETPKVDGRNKAATRERIMDSAMEEFAGKGYHETSMDDIVRRAGISKGAIYFHFPGKEFLFSALVHRLANILEGAVRRSIEQHHGAVARVDAALQTLLQLLSSHRNLAKVVLMGRGMGPSVDDHIRELHNRFVRLIKEYLDHAVTTGSIPPIDTLMAATAWLGAINQIAVRWLDTGDFDPLEKAIPELRALLLRSVGIVSASAMREKQTT